MKNLIKDIMYVLREILAHFAVGILLMYIFSKFDVSDSVLYIISWGYTITVGIIYAIQDIYYWKKQKSKPAEE